MQEERPFDPFAALAEPFSAIKAIHNVRLVDVRQADDQAVRLVVQHNGVTREVAGGGRWSQEWSQRDVGSYGYLVPARHGPGSATGPAHGTSYFRPYADPSLRRVPELDDGKGNCGWVCEAKAGGFLAPSHIIPGREGGFVADKTEQVTVRVPPEFIRECRRVQLSPVELLEGFIGDAAGIQNYIEQPRADGFGSNGSDERDMAEAWIQRAYGMNAVDVFALEEQEAEENDRQMDRDEIGGLLDEFIDNGGQFDDLYKAVQALVDQQRDKAEGT